MKTSKKILKTEYIMAISLDGTRKIISEPHDTPEQLALAHALVEKAAADDRARLSKPKYRLSGKRDALTAVIELAMNNAVDPDDLHSVWAALVDIAEKPSKPAPVLGYGDGYVKYRNGAKVEFFSRLQLKGRLERQRKAR